MSPLNITQPLDSIRYMVYNGYYKVMSNSPKMGHLPTPVYDLILNHQLLLIEPSDVVELRCTFLLPQAMEAARTESLLVFILVVVDKPPDEQMNS